MLAFAAPPSLRGQCNDGRPSPGCTPRPRLDTNTFLVLPFKVSGPPTVSYLSESMVDLLDMSLSGVGGLKVQAAPNALRRVNELPSSEARSGVGVALEWGAGRIIAGTVVAIGNDVRIRAEVYDAVRDRSMFTVDARSAPDNVTQAVDSLAAKILARRLAPASQRQLLMRGEYSAKSPDALRAYFAGRQLALRGLRRESAESLKVALKLDPEFGLAHHLLYTLEAAAGGVTGLSLGTIVRNALEHRDHFPERVQTLVDLANVIVQGERAKAVAMTAALATRYPDDPMVAYHVADQAFHAGRNLGESQESVLAKFRRATSFDDQDAELAVHYATLLQEAGDTVAIVADCQARPQCRPSPEFRAAYRNEDPRDIARGPDSLAWGGLQQFYMRHIPDPLQGLAISEAFAVIQTSSSRAPGLRANAYIARSHIAMARGQYELAWSLLDSAASAGRSSPVYRLLAHIVTGTHFPAGDFDRSTTTFLALQARAWWGAVRLPLDSAEVGLARLESVPWPDSLKGVLIATGLRGLIALRRGDSTRARDLLVRARGSGKYQNAADRLVQPHPWLALVLAQLELAMGSAATARMYLADVYPTNTHMLFIGDVEETRAKIALELADTATARRSLHIVIGVWENGDAVVQPRVASARATLARLDRR